LVSRSVCRPERLRSAREGGAGRVQILCATATGAEPSGLSKPMHRSRIAKLPGCSGVYRARTLSCGPAWGSTIAVNATSAGDCLWKLPRDIQLYRHHRRSHSECEAGHDGDTAFDPECWTGTTPKTSSRPDARGRTRRSLIAGSRCQGRRAPETVGNHYARLAAVHNVSLASSERSAKPGSVSIARKRRSNLALAPRSATSGSTPRWRA
jgi:hypothetical protein